jgi:predicted ATPase/DNA-binding SARP family transcriptional activator
VWFRVLGPLQIGGTGTSVSLPGARLRNLLAALLVDAGKVVSIGRLTDALWEDEPPADPRNAIQTSVARLRERLGDGVPLVTRHPGYLLEVGADQLDALRFEQLLREARDRRDDPARVRALLDDALGLWSGPAYDGFDDRVIQAAARRLEEERLTAVEDRAHARLQLGDVQDLTGELDELLAQHPLRERLVGLQMQVLARQERSREALAVYRRHRARLTDETGLEPSASLRDLEARILRGEPDGSGDRAGTGREGAMGRPIAIPIPPVARPPSVPGATPVPRATTSLVGRRSTIDDILATFAHHRIVTLTGTGGIGKTRLATEVADPADPQARERADWREVAWVELAPVTDPDAIDHVLVATLGVDPGGGRTPREALLDALATRELLLVLDNAEHLLEAIGPVVDQLHQHCPQVRVLTTSRERLAVDGEQVIAIAPLRTDMTGMTGPTDPYPDAVQLFLDRAASTGGGPARSPGQGTAAQLDLVARICDQLDGLPLAIELAAARTGALPLEALLEALQHDDPHATGRRRGHATRHRDLWAVTDWSYRLLNVEEQQLFARLSVFAGAFGVDDAQVVCAPDGQARTTTIQRLAALTEGSLLIRTPDGDGDGTDRYRMLRPLRSFARQRLADLDGTSDLAERHLRHVVDRVEQATSATSATDHRWLEDHLDDVRAAHRHARLIADRDALVRLVGALYWFDQWRAGGELLGWAEGLCDLDGLDAHPAASKVHAAAAAAAWVRGDLALAGRRADHAVTLGDGPDDPNRALAFAVLGDVALFEGRLADAEAACREQSRLGRIGDEADNTVLGLAGAAMALAYRGQHVAAVALADEAARAAPRAGPGARAFVRYAQGETRAEVEPDRAIALLDEAAALARDARAGFTEDVARLTATCLRGRHGEPSTGLPAFAELIRHWRRRGNWLQQWTTLRNLAELLIRLEADEPAVTIIAAAETRETVPPTFGAESERLRTALRTARWRLGEDRFAAAQAAGAPLDGNATVEHALTVIADLASPGGPITTTVSSATRHERSSWGSPPEGAGDGGTSRSGQGA